MKLGRHIIALRAAQHNLSTIGTILAVNKSSVLILVRTAVGIEGQSTMTVRYDTLFLLRKCTLEMGLNLSSIQISLIKDLTKGESD